MELIMARNHTVVVIEGKKYIIDTGSPISFNYYGTETMTLDGKEFAFSSLIACQKDIADKLTGLNISGFIGLDIIKKTNLTINYEKNEVIFGIESGVEPSSEMHVIPFDLFMNNYIVTGNIFFNSNHLDRTIIDTGACISYVSKRYLKDSGKTEESYNDTNPEVGEISGYFYKGKLSFNYANASQIKYNIKVGVMPELFELFGLFDAIIGTGLLSEKYVAFDFNKKRIYFKANNNSEN